MIRQRVSLAVVGTLVAGSALAVGLAAPANAATSVYDPTFTPTTGDLVGAGSDTSEVAVDYLAKGHNGVPGFNAGKTTGRIASYAATPQPDTLTLRDGTSLARPANSGGGRSQLFGTTNNTNFDFARASSSIGTTETAANLQQIPFAVDGLKLAVATTTNAPATISTADMLKIYKGEITTWNQLTGNAAGSTQTIKPYQPPSGSGTRTFFATQLTAANNGTPVTTFGVNVKEAQEHDASVITNDPNAIAPFSTGRAKSAPSIKLIGGLDVKRALFNVFRGSDLSGPKKSIIDAAFRENGFVCSPSARPLIEAAGFDQLASVDNGGVCGVPVQTNVSNYKLSSQQGAFATTTTLTASAANGGVVTLNAELTATGTTSKPVGKVSFRENGVQIAQTNAAGGLASARISGVTPGVHNYTAVFVPTNDANYAPSQAALTSTNVLASSGLSVSAASGTYGVSRVITVNGSGGAANGAVSVSVPGVASATINLVNGVGSMSIPATATVGSRTVTASFAGNASTFGSSASSTLSISQAKTTSTLKLSKKSIKAKKSVKATVTVKISGSSLAANGKVTLKAGSKTIGKGTVKNGKATVTLKKLKKGSLKIKATFAGSSNYGSSVSKTVKLKVTK
jgi:ABC-type phosphate transport system substrate-binding protein